MRTAVKLHQAFFLGGADRPRHRPRTDSHCVLAHPPSILSPPPPSPHPWLGEGGGGERMLFVFPFTLGAAAPGSSSCLWSAACFWVRAPGPNDRLSVGDRKQPPAPCTVYASSVRHASIK